MMERSRRIKIFSMKIQTVPDASEDFNYIVFLYIKIINRLTFFCIVFLAV